LTHDESCFDSGQGAGDFSLFQRAVTGFVDHPASYSVRTGAGGIHEAKGVNFTSRHHILLHLAMSGTTLPLPNTPSCRAQEHFDFHVASCMSDMSLDDEKHSNRNPFQCYVIRPVKEVNKAGRFQPFIGHKGPYGE